MPKKKKTYKELKKELKKRVALESVRNKKIGRYYKKKELEKKVKDLRFKQSKLGRTVVAGKVVFKRIGAVTKQVGSSLGKVSKNLQAQKKKIPPRAISEQLPSEKKKPVKAFNIDEVLSKMPQ